jgi:hypothetical protein
MARQSINSSLACTSGVFAMIAPTLQAEPALKSPQSPDAERFFLASFFIDAANFVPMAAEYGIVERDFTDARNRILYSTALDLHRRSLPIEVSVVNQELMDRGRLAYVGGMDYLLEVSRSQPDTLLARYYAEKVSDISLRRTLIEGALDVAGSNVMALVAEAADRIERRSTGKNILSRLEASRYDPARRLPDVEPVFRLGKVAICTRGNLSTITAQSKSGKSSFLAGMIAATFKDPDHGGDTFTVSGLNTGGLAVVHFDTEQHGKHHERMMDAAMKRAGATTLPPWLHSYARKGASAAELRQELEIVLKAKAREHGGIYAVFLDGAADLVEDVNDPKQTNPLVTWLESLAVRYDCTIACVLHLNPTSGKDAVAKSRGHLGSQLQRKAETDIRLKKDADEITTVFTEVLGTRGEPVFEKDGPRFKYDTAEGMHTTITGTRQDARDDEKAAHLREVAEEVFAGASHLRTSELIPLLMNALRLKSESGAYSKLGEMKTLGVIRKSGYQWNRTV